MSVVAKMVLSLALLAPGLAAAMDEARALREACSDSSQADMRECLANEAAESAKALAQAESQMQNVLANWDEDDKYREEASAALVEANRSFASYRASQCAFGKALSGGAAGNSSELLRLSCEAALNKQRATQLQSAASGVPGK